MSVSYIHKQESLNIEPADVAVHSAGFGDKDASVIVHRNRKVRALVPPFPPELMKQTARYGTVQCCKSLSDNCIYVTFFM
jgi:hypothetical protein